MPACAVDSLSVPLCLVDEPDAEAEGDDPVEDVDVPAVPDEEDTPPGGGGWPVASASPVAVAAVALPVIDPGPPGPEAVK